MIDIGWWMDGNDRFSISDYRIVKLLLFALGI